MSTEKTLFDEQVGSLQMLSSVYSYMKQNAIHMDTDALLRAEYVLLVSSFDSYIHNIVRRKICDNFFTSDHLPEDLGVSIEVVRLMREDGTESGQKLLLDSYLNKLLSKDAYQSPKSIDYALGLIGINRIWSASVSTFGDAAENVKKRMALIVQRRNQIAHEADIDSSTGLPRTISLETVRECATFLQTLVGVIDAQIT